MFEANTAVSQWPAGRAEIEIDPQLTQAASRRNRLESTIGRLTDQISHVTRRNKLYVACTLAGVTGGVVSLMFFATPLFLVGGSVIATVLDVRRRRAEAAARWLRQQRRALEGCANDPAHWPGRPHCAVVGCLAADVCGLN